MSKPKQLEPSIAAIFAKSPDSAFTTKSLVAETHGSPKRVILAAKKQYFPIDDTCAAIAQWMVGDGRGGELVFFNCFSAVSYALACCRACHDFDGLSDTELQALPDFQEAVREPGLAWLYARGDVSLIMEIAYFKISAKFPTVSPFARGFDVEKLYAEWQQMLERVQPRAAVPRQQHAANLARTDHTSGYLPNAWDKQTTRTNRGRRVSAHAAHK
jgi:hypothetical protein